MQLILCKLGREWSYWHCQKHLLQEQSLTHKLNGAELSLCPLLRTSTTSRADGTLPSTLHVYTQDSLAQNTWSTHSTLCAFNDCAEEAPCWAPWEFPLTNGDHAAQLSWTKDITGDRTGSLKTSKGSAVWFPVQALFLLRPSLMNSRNHSPV